MIDLGSIPVSVTGKIDFAGDEDCFTMTPAVDGEYLVTISNMSLHVVVFTDLYDIDNSIIGSGNDSITIALESGRVYYIRLVHPDPLFLGGSYILSVFRVF